MRIIAVTCLLYHCADTLPSAILYTDVVCANESILGKGSPVACELSQGAVHLIQMNLYLVASQLATVCAIAIWRYDTRKTEKMSKICTYVSVFVPLVAMVVTYSMPDISCEDDNFFLIKFRLSFKCFPFMPTLALEWIILWGHFVVGSVAIVYLVFCIIRAAHKVAPAPTSASKRNGIAFLQYMRRHLVVKKGTEKLVLIGLVSAILLVINVVVNALSIAGINEFEEKSLLSYYGCTLTSRSTTFEGLVKECRPLTTNKVPAATLAVGFFATSFSALCFCAVFAWDNENVKLIRKRFGMTSKTTKLSSRSSHTD